MNEFWAICLQKLKLELPTQQFNTWIKGLSVSEGANSNEMLLAAPNRFVMHWVRERWLPQIEAMATEYFNGTVRISLQCREPASDIDLDLRQEDLVSNSGGTTPETPGESLRPVNCTNSIYDKTRLNRDFTFDSMITGRANDMASAAARQIAQNPGISYNPLFVYGESGLGKTHLLQAIGNEIFAANPGSVIRYVHTLDYVTDVVQAFAQKSFDHFKNYYRSIDVLLIDDIQFISGNKVRTQEEFFYVFNSLVDSKKQIVITCDTFPKSIQGLNARLVSRFDWGLTVAIEPPELEMRVAILKKKAASENVTLADDVAFLIAKNLRSNVRELEGALNRIIAYAGFHGKAITIDVAKEGLKDILSATNRHLTIEHIQKTVADFYRIKVADMYSQRRTRSVVRPRQVAMWLAREITDRSLPEIGDAFGGRDHTTVIHACRTINDLKINDQTLANELHVLMQTIRD